MAEDCLCMYRRQWKRVGRWRSTLSKQQFWVASPRRLSMLLTPTIPWRLQLCHRAWRQPWPVLRGHWKLIASAGGSPLVSPAQFGADSRPQDCPVLMAVENLLRPINCGGSWSIQVALLLALCYSSLYRPQIKHSNRSLSSSVSTCTSWRTEMVLFNCGNFY